MILYTASLGGVCLEEWPGPSLRRCTCGVARPRGRAIGGELVRRMLARLDGLYMVDLLCAPGLQPFYVSPGMLPASGMTVYHYTNQPGKKPPGAIYWAHEGRSRTDQHHRR